MSGRAAVYIASALLGPAAFNGAANYAGAAVYVYSRDFRVSVYYSAKRPDKPILCVNL